MVNNRAYGQVLTYGSGVQWGWHDSGSIDDRARNVFMDLLMGHNQLYLPPLSSATVGILKPKPGADVTFTIWPTWQTIGADIVFYALGQIQHLPIEKAFDKAIKVGEGACYAIGPETALTDISVAAIRDDIGKVAKCFEEALALESDLGVMSDTQVSEIESFYGKISTAKVVGKGLLVADVVWKIGDLVSDAILRDMPRGNGFEVQATNGSSKSNPPPPPTVTPVPPHQNPTPTPVPPHAQPTPTPAPQPPSTWAETAGPPTGSGTFTNYTNAGGTLGQRIAPYQTIQVSCRLTGFKVADGNTWWYRVASTPWSNAYYAPADNFYNNGQTSGSLSGTPFVDPNVPNC